MSSGLSEKVFDQLSQNRLFEGIEPDLLKQIRRQVDVLEFKSGEVVFHEGDPGNSLYLVGEGSVKIYKDDRAGREQVLDYIKPRNFLGEMARLEGKLRSDMSTAAE